MTAYTDYIDQHVRCYTVPAISQPPRERQRQPGRIHGVAARPSISPEGQTIKAIGAPYEGWCLVFDTETTTDTSQALRFGFYAIYGISRDERMRLHRADRLTREALDTPHSAGVFYDAVTLTPAEVDVLQVYARLHDLECMTRDAFITTVFYPWVYRYGALCIGHNLPFDLGALATHWTEAGRRYRGGFALTLCDCRDGQGVRYKQCFDHPPIRVKQLGRMKAMIQIAVITLPTKIGRPRVRKRPGHFLDTATLGRALLGPGDSSLAGLGRRFDVAGDVCKASAPAHGATLTAEYLDYARQDVAATWALYQAERDLYRRHGVSKPLWSIYSEASLGKAYFEEMGVPRFRQQHPNFPPEVLGYGMVAYYGGRSEVRIRLQPTEVIYTDFKSQYPTVNALMRLQDLLLAERIEVRQGVEVAAEVRAWLALVAANGPDELHSSEAWQRLRCLVKVRPAGDLLPVRARFAPHGGETNIAVTYLTGLPVWYTLADIVASTLLTGRAPEVLEALELVPVGRVETRPLDLFGNPRYRIDLNERDLFTGVIDLRGEVRAELTQVRTAADGAHDPVEKALLDAEAERLHALQLALKLLANSTSYGVLVEVNTAEPTVRSTPATVYGMDTRHAHAHKIEQPGPYYAGAIGALIPGAGRLLLALAERLAADRGIGYALCDTDSMVFARPAAMERTAFQALVGEVCAWFTPLSPYRAVSGVQPPLLEREDVNDWHGKPEPLYALAVSAKRYALYNRLPDDADGSYRIRKFSSHGVGTWQGQEGYTSPPHVPDPCEPVRKLANGAGERWAYDLWYDAIAAIDGGAATRGDTDAPWHSVRGSAWLDLPAFHQLTISTARLYRMYRDIPDIRPFTFITVLPALDGETHRTRHTNQQTRGLEPAPTGLNGRDITAWAEAGDDGGDDADDGADNGASLTLYDGLQGVTYYAPYVRDAADLHDVRRVDTGARVPVGLRHKTVAECVENYYRHPELKAAVPYGVGVLPRRHVRAVQHIHIGKEMNQVQQEAVGDTDGTIGEIAPQEYGASGLADSLRPFHISELVLACGVPCSTITNVLRGATPTPAVQRTLRAGLTFLMSAHGQTLVGWRNVPRAYLVEHLGLPIDAVQTLRDGTRRASARERAGLIAAVRQWREECGVRAALTAPPCPPRSTVETRESPPTRRRRTPRQKGRSIMEEYGSVSYDAYDADDDYETYPIGAPHTPDAPDDGNGHDAATRSSDWSAAQLDLLRRAVQTVRRERPMPVIAAESGLTRDTLYKFLRGATLRPAHADSLLAALKRLRLADLAGYRPPSEGAPSSSPSPSPTTHGKDA